MGTLARILAAALLLAAGTAQAELVSALAKGDSTRALGLSGAATALGRDTSLVWLNPAAIATATDPALMLGGQRGLIGDTTGQFLFTSPLYKSALALGGIYYNLGSLLVNTSDGGTRRFNLQQDLMASLTYAWMVSPAIAAGMTFKGLRSTLFEEFSSSALAADFGVQAGVTRTIKAGVAVHNVGTRLRYLDDPVSVPTAASAGLAAGFRVDGTADTALFTADAEKVMEGGALSWSGGAEYQWRQTASLRMGFRLPPSGGQITFSLGAGVRVESYQLDYSVRFGGPLDAPQTLSLTVVLPRIAAAQEPETGEPETPSFAAPAPAMSLSEPEPDGTPSAPELNPAEPAPLPTAPERPAGDAGLIDDLNRQLDDILERKSEKAE